MIFFFKSDGTLIKSAPDTVYQGSTEAGKIYVVMPFNANAAADVYFRLPNGENWGPYILTNHGVVTDSANLPTGWGLWSVDLESAITQYAGTLTAQFGFYQSGTANKVPLITTQGVTITIARGVVRDLPEQPTADIYKQILSAIDEIHKDIDGMVEHYLQRTTDDKIALKNNESIDYSKAATANTIAQRTDGGQVKVADGVEDNDAASYGQNKWVLNYAETNLKKKLDITGEATIALKNNGWIGYSTEATENTLALRDSNGRLKASDGEANDDLATIRQLNLVEKNAYSDITNIDLNTGDTTVEYDTQLGITVTAKGTVTHKNGNTEQPTTKFELPIIAGEGIVIDKADGEEKIVIRAVGGGNIRVLVIDETAVFLKGATVSGKSAVFVSGAAVVNNQIIF